MKRRTITLPALALATLALLPLTAAAQQPATHRQAVDLGAFAKETVAFRIDRGQQHYVMWMPYEFFVITASAEGTIPRESMEKELAFLKPYVTLLVMASIGKPDGTEVFASEAEVRRRAVLKLGDGTEVRSLEAVPPKLSAVVAAMKAVMAQQGGADRANLHMVVFPAATAAGKQVVDESRKGSLNLVLKADARFREAAFTWHTPFDALTAVPDCPRCKAGVSAKWTYCPYCGQKLPQ